MDFINFATDCNIKFLLEEFQEKNKLKKLTYFLLLLILSSCGTSTIMVNVQKPADITVSNNIKNIVLANRTTPSKSNLANNI